MPCWGFRPGWLTSRSDLDTVIHKELATFFCYCYFVALLFCYCYLVCQEGDIIWQNSECIFFLSKGTLWWLALYDTYLLSAYYRYDTHLMWTQTKKQLISTYSLKQTSMCIPLMCPSNDPHLFTQVCLTNSLLKTLRHSRCYFGLLKCS